MTDTTNTVASAAPAAPEPQGSRSQAWVAFTIVICVTLIALGCIIISGLEKPEAPTAFIIVGTVAGGLINALQAPSGISSVIASALSKKPTPPTEP